MCESNAYLNKEDSQELLLKDVGIIKPLEEGKLFLENIFGEELTVKARIVEINFQEHKIVLE